MRFDRLFLILRYMDYTVCRSGGATTAAKLDISDRLFKGLRT
jgi:hypothetical protein